MSRESAVTESVSYQVEACQVCGTEVGLVEDIPEGELVKPGYAVLVGEGTVSITDEQAGNWSAKVKFAGAQSDTNPPSVEGHILCEECAEAVHDHTTNTKPYRGPLPDVLTTGTSSPELPISDRTLVAIALILLLLIIALLV